MIDGNMTAVFIKKNNKLLYVIIFFIFIFLLEIIFTSQICLSNQIITVGALSEAPPGLYLEDGEYKGYDYELYKEVKKRLGENLQLELYSFKRLIERLKNGRIDISLHLYHNKKREEYAMYSKLPLRWADQYIFVKAENVKNYASNDIKALYGKRVGKISGFFVNDEFSIAGEKDLFVIDEAGSLQSNLHKLYLGRIDCVISELYTTLYNIKKIGRWGDIIPLEKPLVTGQGVYMALSRKGRNISDKEKFLEKLNGVLKEMHSRGIVDKIITSYIYNENQ